MKTFVSRLVLADCDNVISVVKLVGLNAVELDAHDFAGGLVLKAESKFVASLLRSKIFIEQTFDLHAV